MSPLLYAMAPQEDYTDADNYGVAASCDGMCAVVGWVFAGMARGDGGMRGVLYGSEANVYILQNPSIH